MEWNLAANWSRGRWTSQPKADDDSLTPAEKRLLVILGIGGLVVLLIVLAVNMLSGDDKAEPSNQAEPTETIAAGPDPGSFASGGGILDRPAATVPTNTPPVKDDLSRDSLTGGPLNWEALGSGSWQVQDNSMVVASEPEGATPLAVAEVPGDIGSSWQFSVVVVQPANGAGFVFGVQDAENFWEVKFNSDFAGAQVNHVVAGKPARATLIKLIALQEQATWTVQHVGEVVTLSVDGEPVLALSDPSLDQSRKVGVVASADAPAIFAAPQMAGLEGG